MRSAMSHTAVVSVRMLTMLAALTTLLVAGVTSPARAADAKPGAAKPATKQSAPAKKARAKPAPPEAEVLKQMVEGEDVRDFRTFCNTWMGKLKDRTTYNEAHIPWTKGGSGVVGEYVSYGTERTCIAREEPGKDPIGKITYREVKYRKEGATETAAMGSAGAIVEQTDVTEIFRFAKGRWVY
jgi:hypothetical protein